MVDTPYTKGFKAGMEYKSPGEGVRAFYREQGASQEQERIIKLLETDIATNNKDYSGEMEWGLYKAIELIKGETNELPKVR